MINKKMIETFKKIENLINNFDFFQFYEFDDFINNYIDDDEYENTSYIDDFKNKYNCNNENTIVLLYNCDDDEYLTINFENDTLIISQNIEIEHVNDDVTQNALYEILYNLFCECE